MLVDLGEENVEPTSLHMVEIKPGCEAYLAWPFIFKCHSSAAISFVIEPGQGYDPFQESSANASSHSLLMLIGTGEGAST